MTLIRKAPWQLTDDEIIDKALDGIQDDLRRQGFAEGEVEKVKRAKPHFHRGFRVLVITSAEGSMGFAKKKFADGMEMNFESGLKKTVHAAGKEVCDRVDMYVDKVINKQKIIRL
jgi:hypothetical protein